MRRVRKLGGRALFVDAFITPPLLCQVMRGRRRYGQLFFHLLPLVSLVQEYSPFLFVRYSRNFCRTNTCREEKGNLVERCGKSNGGRGSTVAVKFFPVFSLSLTDGIRFLCPHPLSPPHWQFEMQRGRKDIGIPLTLFFSGERTTAQFPLQKNKMEVWEGEREKESSFASARMRRILTVLSPFFFSVFKWVGNGFVRWVYRQPKRYTVRPVRKRREGGRPLRDCETRKREKRE